MIATLKIFLNDAVALGKLPEDYRLQAKRNLDSSTSSPGVYVFDIIKDWQHFSKP